MTLALVILVPLAGAFVVAVCRTAVRAARIAAVVTSVATLGASVAVLADYSLNGPVRLDLGRDAAASTAFLFADGLAIPLVLLTGIVGFVAVLASLRVERASAHLALVLALEAAVAAVFLAADLIVLYVAWEAVLIPMFFLIGGWGHENRRYAAMKFFLYTFTGSALMLVGIVMLALGRGGVTSMIAPADALAPASQTVVFWLLAAGFLVKVPAWPLHTWLPDAHVEAPTGGSIMLAGVLLKMGGYGLIRLCIGFTPDAFERFAPVIAVLGVIGIVYGAAMALAQDDLKRLIAYSSVAHMGFVLLAAATGTPLGLAAALLVMVSHGVVSAALFFLAGALYDRAHTRQMAAVGGLGVSMPLWSTAFVLASLAGLGLPGLSGFPGEFGALMESFARFGWLVVASGLGVLLAGGYALRSIRLVVHGESDASRSWPDLDAREIVAIVALLTLVIVLGLWPRLVTDLARSSLEALGALVRAVS
jgi:NADH-quinone oxidoreductase subunit M